MVSESLPARIFEAENLPAKNTSETAALVEIAQEGELLDLFEIFSKRFSETEITKDEIYKRLAQLLKRLEGKHLAAGAFLVNQYTNLEDQKDLLRFRVVFGRSNFEVILRLNPQNGLKKFYPFFRIMRIISRPKR